MAELGDGLRLAAEALQPIGILRQRLGQRLDGYIAVEAFITGAETHAHAASAELLLDPVAANPPARRQHHQMLASAPENEKPAPCMARRAPESGAGSCSCGSSEVLVTFGMP